jgi:hypothetical protein
MGLEAGRRPLVACAAAALVLLGGCNDSADPADTTGATSSPDATGAGSPLPPDEEAPPRSVWLTFVDVRPGEVVDSLTNAGDLPVTVDVASLGGGELRGERGPRRGAVRLPEWDRSDPAYAVLRMRGTGPDDVLSPDERDFTFGADFSLDATSSGTSADNGDNLIQRGLFEGPGQYKIQVDHGKLSCRVSGLEGDVLTRIEERVEPGTWYRARCTRRGDTVTLMMAELLPDFELGEWSLASDTGSIGAVVMPRHTPMSVGGKLATDGSIFPGSTDQLNGVVDRIMYRLLDGPGDD